MENIFGLSFGYFLTRKSNIKKTSGGWSLEAFIQSAIKAKQQEGNSVTASRNELVENVTFSIENQSVSISRF